MAGRAPYLIFASFLGAAIALLVYRFGVMSLAWDPPEAKVFTFAPAVMVIASWQLVRQTEVKQWPWVSVVATSLASFGAVMLISYFALPSPARSELVARQLPGMTVSLPSGKEDTAELGYASGELTLSNVAHAGGVISVRWSPGEVEESADLELLAQALESAAKGKGRRVEQWPGPGGSSISAILVETKKGTMAATFVACGERRVFFNGMGDDALHALFRRVIRSFVCQPDPAKEEAMSGMPWTLASLPEGWQAYDEKGGRFSNGESHVAVEQIEKPWSVEVVRLSVEMAFGKSGAKVVVGPLQDDRMALEITDEDEDLVGWIRQFACPRGAVLVISIAMTEEVRAATDELVKSSGRCLNEGEPAPRWPVAEESEETEESGEE